MLFSFLDHFLLLGSDRDRFKLLCADGSQAPLSHYRSCNLGHGPGGGVVTRFNFRKVARKLLQEAQVFFFPHSPLIFPLSRVVTNTSCWHTKHSASLSCPPNCNRRISPSSPCLAGEEERSSASSSSDRRRLEKEIFSSGMRRRSCPFWPRGWTSVRCWAWTTWRCSKASDTKVRHTLESSTAAVLFSPDARCAGSSLEDSVVRWCCISYAEQKKCEQWALSIKSDPLVCVRAVSMRECVEKMKASQRGSGTG